MKPSNLQVAIFKAVRDTNDSLLIVATSGSGKSTTIVKSSSYISVEKYILFLSFNKSIADELKSKIPSHANALTFNSLGHRAIQKHFGRVKLSANKTRAICRDMLIDYEFRQYADDVVRLVGLAKSYCLSPEKMTGTNSTDENFMWLINRFGFDVEVDQLKHFISITRDVLEAGIGITSTIDYDDQLYLPVILNINMTRYDVLFVDEAQDVSPVKLAIISKSLDKNGRVIAVGDPNQAINGFTGSDEESLSKIKGRFDCRELPLSISYRCAKNIVLYANQYVKEIQAFDQAPDGTVCCWHRYDGSEFKPTDLMMCRNTAPLITMAFSLIARRVASRVLGREIGEKLIKLIGQLRPTGLFGKGGLAEKLNTWQEYEAERLIAKGEEDKADAIMDRHDSIIAFLDNSTATTIDRLKGEIRALFNDKDNCMTLCTAHKAKGLEAPRAFILNPDLMPSQYARQEWDKAQEQNLIFVAITRAKTDLVFIRSSDFEVM